MAFDAQGNTGESQGELTIRLPGTPDTTAPTVTLTTTPSTVTDAGTVTLKADAADNVGVNKVSFYRGQTLIGEDTTAPYEVQDAVTVQSNGQLLYRAVATDAAGNMGESTTTVMLVSSVPTFMLTATPTPLSVERTGRIDATINVNGIGRTPAPTDVTFTVKHAPAGVTANMNGATLTVVATSIPTGTYSGADGITVVGTSAAGHAEVTLTLVVTEVPAPVAPANFTVNSLATEPAVRLSWSAVGGATGYRIERRVGQEPYADLVTLDLVTTFDDKNLPGGRYSYRIRAVRNTAEGPAVEAQTVVASAANVSVKPSTAAVYVKQTLGLVAEVKDESGMVLPGRRMVWSSSDRAVATVDASGIVTAIAPGTAVISGAVDGQTGKAQIQVLARPTPNWSAATEWTGHNGNAAHTGFVAATVDPLVFRKSWSSTLAPGARLNPVAVGGNKVLVTTNSYFGQQFLMGVNLANGQTEWTHDFGGIHSVHDPAYANGRVYLTTGGHEDAYLYAFDAATGTLAYRSNYDAQWERYFAPVIEKGRVYMAGGTYGGMYAYNEADGQRKWFLATNQYDMWTPAVKDSVVYAYTGSYSPKLQAVDGASGTELFNIPDPAFIWSGWSMNSAPAIGGLNDVVATASGRVVSFDLTKKAIGWALKDQYSGTATIADATVYLKNASQVEARNEADGALKWMWISPDNAAIRSVIATNNILFVSTTTTTVALDLNSHTAIWSHPEGGELSLSNQGVLLIAQATGKLTAITVK